MGAFAQMIGGEPARMTEEKRPMRLPEKGKVRRKARWIIVDWLFIAVLASLVTYLHLSFRAPDVFLFQQGAWSVFAYRLVLWGPLLLFLGFAVLWYLLRSKKISSSSAVLLVGILVFLAPIGYLVANHYYKKSINTGLDEYHPYLQLVPPQFRPRHDSTKGRSFVIFCLGGSTTEFKNSIGEDWPSLLERRLNSNGFRRQVQVYNFGRQWYTSLHTLINYEVNLRQYKPDLIIVMQSINDLLHNASFSHLSRGEFREDYGHFYGPLARLIVKRDFGEYLLSVVRDSWQGGAVLTVETDTFPGLSVYRRNLNTLIDLALIDRSSVVLMSEPSIYRESMRTEELDALTMIRFEAVNKSQRWSLMTAKRGMEAYNAAIQEVASERSVLFINLDKVIPKSMEYFWDDVHYKDPAFELIAQTIASNLLESNLFSD